MDSAADFLVGKSDDHPFDLPPMAEAQHISLVAAVLGACRCLEPGIVAIGFEQQCRIGQRGSSMDVGRVHGGVGNPAHLAVRRTDRVNETSTMIFPALAAGSFDGHGGAMNRRSTAAGGIFLFLGLLIGAIYGINEGQPMLWMLRGFGAGIVLAVLVWFIDRRRD